MLALVFGVALCTTEPEVSPADLARFPSREVAWSTWRFAQAHDAWLRSHGGFSDTRLVWEPWIDEHHHGFLAWSHLADAWGQHGTSDWAARHYLQLLRRVLGREAYWLGRMPESCPWWRFEQRDP
jgi:hypothetical protein